MFIPPTTTTVLAVPPRHVRELQKRLDQLVLEYRRENPDVPEAHIRAALQMALADESAPTRRTTPAIWSVVLGAAVALGLVVMLLFRKGAAAGAATPTSPRVMIAIAVAALAAVAVVLLRHRPDD
jgi:hypothetical protein